MAIYGRKFKIEGEETRLGEEMGEAVMVTCLNEFRVT
jgi:hypothetical protein